MPTEAETRETIVNVIKERPELLRNINVAITAVLAEAGLDVGDLAPSEILEAIASSIGGTEDPGDVATR